MKRFGFLLLFAAVAQAIAAPTYAGDNPNSPGGGKYSALPLFRLQDGPFTGGYTKVGGSSVNKDFKVGCANYYNCYDQYHDNTGDDWNSKGRSNIQTLDLSGWFSEAAQSLREDIDFRSGFQLGVVFRIKAGKKTLHAVGWWDTSQANHLYKNSGIYGETPVDWGEDLVTNLKSWKQNLGSVQSYNVQSGSTIDSGGSTKRHVVTHFIFENGTNPYARHHSGNIGSGQAKLIYKESIDFDKTISGGGWLDIYKVLGAGSNTLTAIDGGVIQDGGSTSMGSCNVSRSNFRSLTINVKGRNSKLVAGPCLGDADIKVSDGGTIEDVRYSDNRITVENSGSARESFLRNINGSINVYAPVKYLDGSYGEFTLHSANSNLNLNGKGHNNATVALNAGSVANGSVSRINARAGLIESINGSTVVEKTGTGTTTVKSSTYSGRTTVSAGTLQALGANAFSRSSEHVVKNGATLNLNNQTQSINNVTVDLGGNVKDGTLVNRNLTTAGDVNLTGIEQNNGAITNSGTITLGAGSLKATRVVNSGNLTAAGSAEVENLINSGNATFNNYQGTSSSGNYSIESSGNVAVTGNLSSISSVYLKGSASGNVGGNVDVESLYVGGLPSEKDEVIPSGTTRLDVAGDLIASGQLLVGSDSNPHASIVALQGGDLYSDFISVMPQASIVAPNSTIYLTNEKYGEGQMTIFGDVEASTIKGSPLQDLFSARPGSSLKLNGTMPTALGECADGCDAAINFAEGNDLFTTAGTSISISAGSVIDGGDIGSLNAAGEWEGEINVYRNYSPTQSPGFDRDQLKNFALVNYDGNWESAVDQGNCKFDDAGNLSVSSDTSCLLLAGTAGSNNTIVITNGATLRNGVTTLDGKTLVGAQQVSGSTNTIKLENGNLFAVLLEGNDAATNSIELGTEAGGTGALALQSLSGYDNLIQRGGSWTYDIKGYGSGAPLDLQLQAGDVTIDNKADTSDRGEATFAAINATGAVQSTITNKGDLTVYEGITGNAALITANGAFTYLDGTSTYAGDTEVQAGGQLNAVSAQALSAESDHQVAGTLDLGDAAQTVQSLTLDSGAVQNGTLTSTGGVFSNAGRIDAELAGGAGLTVTGDDATTKLQVAPTYTGNTQVDAKANLLLDGVDASIGTLTGEGDVSLGGNTLTIDLNDGEESLFEGRVLGSSTNAAVANVDALVKTGTGTLTLAQFDSTYTPGEKGWFKGNFEIEEGAVVLQSLTGDCNPTDADRSAGAHCRTVTVAEGASLVTPNGGVFTSKLDGAGQVLVQGAGKTLHLRNRNTPAAGGSFEIDPGAQLQISANSGIKGFLGNWDVENNGTLKFSKSPGQTASGSISGSGDLVYVTERGDLTFTGNHTYTGATTVKGNGIGALVFEGTLGATDLSVESGGAVKLEGVDKSIASLTLASADASESPSTALVQDQISLSVAGATQIQSNGQFSGDGALSTESLVNQGDVSGFGGGIALVNTTDATSITTGVGVNPTAQFINTGNLIISGSIDASEMTQDITAISTDTAAVGGTVALGSGSDVLVNAGSGSLDVSGSVNNRNGYDAAIDLGLGNDLLLTDGSIVVSTDDKLNGGDGAYIDGGSAYLGAAVGGGYAGEINVYLNEGAAPAPEVYTEDQLKNFALIKWSKDHDWELPTVNLPGGGTLQPKACVVSGERVVSDDETCLLVFDKKLQAPSKSGNVLRINNGATLNAGVVSLGANNNTLALEKGDLNAVVLYGGDAVADSIVLGGVDGAGGSLNVGLISRYDSLVQKSGTWNYTIGGYHGVTEPLALDLQGGDVQIAVTTGAKTNRAKAVFNSIKASGDGERAITNSGDLVVIDGVTGNASLSTNNNAVTILGGSSTYTGDTVVEAGGTLAVLNSDALSAASEHTISGTLELGGEGISQAVKSLQLKGGTIGEGVLTATAGVTSTGGTVDAVLAGEKGLKVQSGTTTLNAANTYSGDTKIDGGTLVVRGALADATAVSVAKGATYQVESNDTIGSLAGASGSALKLEGSTLTVGANNASTTFAGVVSGDGGLQKEGLGRFTLSGNNTYAGSTTVSAGVLELGGSSAIPAGSKTTVTGTGQLDLYSNNAPSTFAIDQIRIDEQGQLQVSGRHSLTSQSITLATDAKAFGLFAHLTDPSTAPINMASAGSGFVYSSGQVAVDLDADVGDPSGRWAIVSGDVVNAEEMALNTHILTKSGGDYTFPGLGSDQLNTDDLFYNAYLEKGSLNLIIDQEKELIVNDDLDDCLFEGNCPDTGNGLSVELPSWWSKLNGKEQDILKNILSGVLDGWKNNKFDIPFGTTIDQVGRLIGSGLTPRNVDGGGRGLSTYNNLLVDTVFERLPLRQFSKVETVAVEPQPEAVIEEPPAAEQLPVRGLWSKSGEVSDPEADAYLDQATAEQPLVIADASANDLVIRVDGSEYLENPSLTAEYAERDGVRGWFRGFGGNSGPSQSGVMYNDYYVNAGGGVVGVDVSVAPQVQIGAFANYGNINLSQINSGTGGGSWNPDGWGGGVTADYWTDNFYVQGLFAATGFSGSQSRSIIKINDNLGDETARGEKSATSYAYALRIGAPFETGSVVLEPQFAATWSQNQEHGYSESGVDNLNLRYSDRTTTYLQTELGMKLSWPIKSGDQGLWVPSLKLAWLGDWDQNNEAQKIGYEYTKQTVNFDSDQEDTNGALIEVGLDYTIANLNSSSWKVYVKGGAEVWGGDRGTDWRSSGGVTWQF